LRDIGFEADWFEPLAEVEAESFWFRSRNRLVLWALDSYFPGAQSLLEIGCGTGFVLSAIRVARPDMSLTGGDAMVEGLRIARRRLSAASLLQLDARRLPFDSEFDVVVAFDVLEHIAEDDLVLAEMHRATRPGGGAIVLVPQHPWLWNDQEDSGHVRRYRRKELCGKLEAAGFRVERWTSFVSLPLPLMFASRRLGCRRATADDPVRELRTGRGLGRALERVLDAERRMIARGARLPAGGSLLVIVRKCR
jgi:SAM-dependent methyltransferase